MKKIIVLLALIIILFIPIFPKLLINNKIFNIEKKEFIISYTHSVNRGRV